ncbi:MAG: hypothetical protein ACTSQQ_07175 [Candidatus Helarchaeota archaeon]
MLNHKKSALIIIVLLTINPMIAFFSLITGNGNIIMLKDNPIRPQTYDSEFHNLTCISDNPLGSNTDFSWMARIAIDSQDHLHVVWADDTDDIAWGNDWEILYSSFDGISWSAPIAISDFATAFDGISEQPSIAIDSQDNIHVVWTDNTPGLVIPENPESIYEILYRMYNATTSTWSAISVISDNSSKWHDKSARVPFIAIDRNDDLHVVWEDYVKAPTVTWSSGESEIIYIRQINGSWTGVMVVSDNYTDYNSFNSQFPSIAVDTNNIVHIVWEDFYPGAWGSDREIFYKNYTPGVGLGALVALSGIGSNIWNVGDSQFPIIASDPNTNVLHVVWQDDTDSPEWGSDTEIFYSCSNNGVTWTNATVLSGIGVNAWNNGDSYGPWITVDNLSRIHVAWHDDTNSTSEWGIDREIFYSNSTDGITWLNGTCLSEQPDHTILPNDGLSQEPCIAYDSTNFVHVVWWDDSSTYPWSPDYDILYTTNYYSVGTPALHPITPNPSPTGVIQLSWTAASYAAYYKLYRSNTPINNSVIGALTPITTTRSTSYIDTVLSNGTYYYALIAHNVGGDGSLSNCESVKIVPPSPPSGWPWWWLIILLVAIVLGVSLYLRKRRKKNA